MSRSSTGRRGGSGWWRWKEPRTGRRTLTKTLAREFARWNIRVNGLALTITSGTDAFDAAMARDDWVTQLFKKAVSRFPSGKPPTAEEVARVAVFLASDQSAQLTGQTLSVNGGLSYAGW